MIRKPLRPLARIFSARTAGENPDLIEHANRRERIEMQHERILRKTQRRLFMMGGIFVISFGGIGMRMTALAASMLSSGQTDLATDASELRHSGSEPTS